ncbi:MAG: FkbM family methyltransferase [Alphaproteobacteria bacterium]
MQETDIYQVAEARKTTVETAAMTIHGRDRDFAFFESGRKVVTDVLSGKTYPLVPFITGVGVILDIGANVGAASIYFHSAYGEARIFAFEPHSGCFGLLSGNSDGIDAIRAFNIGLHDHAEEAQLHLSKFDFATNSIGDYAHNLEDSETIRLQPALQTVRQLDIEAIDILKLDTEGCEVPVLEDLLGGYRPRVIYLEYHSDRDRYKIDALLRDDYLLYFGHIPTPHRGEMCYVLKTAIPEDESLMRLEIG